MPVFKSAFSFAESIGKAVSPQNSPVTSSTFCWFRICSTVFAASAGWRPARILILAMLGCGHPMGPLAEHFIGLDTILYIADIMFDELKDALFRAAAVTSDGERVFGKKSGRGFASTTRNSVDLIEDETMTE
jgi:3-hydroxyacyl-CoA dehydrogenase